MMDATKLAGQQIDRYHILQHLARGGMADVYLAEDLDLHRRVALKVLLDVLAAEEPFVQRFRREARTVAQLEHPNIVQVYGTGLTPTGQPYIAMQFIDGPSLSEKLNEFAEAGRLAPTTQVLALVRQIAAALAAAHQAGVIHRDLKPANILIRSDGTPVLVDLGIAMVQGGPKLTQTGNLIGTPNYMSPEQVRGLPLDGRSDLYSLGVILYEMLCGKRPFSASESVAILHQHVYETPQPVTHYRTDLSAATLAVVETCLAKEPGDRYQSATELVAAIDHALAVESRGSPLHASTVWLPHPDESEFIYPNNQVWRPDRTFAPLSAAPPSAALLPAGTLPAKSARHASPAFFAGLVVLVILAAVGFFSWWNGHGAGEGVRETAVIADLPAASLVVPTRVEAAPTATASMAGDFTTLPTSQPTASPTPATPTHTPESPIPALPETFTGLDGKLMRLIPAGEFIMGSTQAQVEAAAALCRVYPDQDPCVVDEFASEMPQRRVFLSAFYMDETEVTNDEYRACVNARFCQLPAEGTGIYRRSSYFENAATYVNYPVVYVSWQDAAAYCTWAGKRLPTEAEWEKGARGPDGRIYPWGNVFDPSRANTEDRGREAITAVGQFPTGASPYGLQDMAGNVWEYVNDWFDPDYYASAPTSDPPGPESSPTGEKVLRSGSYANFQHYARVANRGSVTVTSSTQFRGFRCAIDAAQVGEN